MRSTHKIKEAMTIKQILVLVTMYPRYFCLKISEYFTFRYLIIPYHRIFDFKIPRIWIFQKQTFPHPSLKYPIEKTVEYIAPPKDY